MANLFQYINKTPAFDKLADALFTELFLKAQDETISEAEIELAIKEVLETLFTRIAQQSFTYKPAYHTPVSGDYNTMIASFTQDIDYLLTDCEQIGLAVSSSFIDSEIASQFNQVLVRSITQKSADLKAQVKRELASGKMLYTESFSAENLMANGTADNACSIDKHGEILTLKTESTQLLLDDAKVEILSHSNGFPGNTHNADLMESTVVFDGQSNPHFDLNEMIDGNLDTWFEYELFDVSEEVMEQVGYFGFDYKEGISWVREHENPLTLSVKLTLPTPTPVNWLSISPFLSEQKGVKAPFLTGCVISDGGGVIQTVKQSQRLDRDIIVTFEPQLVSDLTLTFTQKESQVVNVGHRYYLSTNRQNAGHYTSTDSDAVRIDGPSPSVQHLGIHYDPLHQTFKQPSNDGENLHIRNIEQAKSNLFTTTTSLENQKSGIELLSANRLSIGIKNISLSYQRYQEVSEYVSAPLTATGRITKLLFEADEYVPTDYRTTPDALIAYHISVDSGVSWLPIYPRHRANQGFCAYEINDGDIERYLMKTNSHTTGVITSLEDVTSILVKITLTKPAGVSEQTPYVKNYRVQFESEEVTM